MQDSTVDLGCIRMNAPRAEIVEIKRSADTDFAIFQVRIDNRDREVLCKIADGRPETIEAAKIALKLSEEHYRNTRGRGRRNSPPELIEALKNVRATLNSGIADGLIERTVVGGGRRQQVNIALFPVELSNGETEEDLDIRTFALIHTKGPWKRFPYYFEHEKPLATTRREGQGNERKIVASHLHFIWTDKPVVVYQVEEENQALFIIDSTGVNVTYYPSPNAAIETPAVEPAAVDAPVNENPDEIVHCNVCHSDGAVRTSEIEAKTAVCPICQTPIGSDFTILRDADLGLSEDELALLQTERILTVEALAETGPEQLKAILGLKQVTRAKNLVAKAKEFVQNK